MAAEGEAIGESAEAELASVLLHPREIRMDQEERKEPSGNELV